MAGPAEEFFDELGRRRHDPRLEQTNGIIRVELVEGLCTEQWYVEINAGDVTVSRESMAADASFRAERALFDRAASGEANLTAALLRGAVSIEGDLELVARMERLLPGPSGSAPRRLGTGAGSQPS